jgi:hypothetical protein
MDSYGEAKERVVNDMKRLLSDSEDLLRAVGIDSKDKVAALRPRVEPAISQARTHLSEMERAVEQGARRARPTPMFTRIRGGPPVLLRGSEPRSVQSSVFFSPVADSMTARAR